ncbi:MAG: hypothetical protein LBL54_02505, partial [Clostridiales Family XIII bacterium]|nr:hypothetical protein [Clostridiales Family XIII bacterium]
MALILLLAIEPVRTAETFADSGGSIIDISDDDPSPSSGSGWRYSGGVYTILNGANVIVEGTNAGTENRLTVDAGATAYITLHNVTIDGLDNGQSPLLLSGGARANLLLEGMNSLTGGFGAAGIYVPIGTAITISGSGSLDVNAGNGGADIGTSYYSNDVGDQFIAAEVNGRRDHAVVGNPVIIDGLTVIVPTGFRITVPPGGSLTVNGRLSVNGTLENEGALNVFGTLRIVGVLNNGGNMNNMGTIDISGALNNNGLLTNNGMILIGNIGALKGSGEMAGEKIGGADVSPSTLRNAPTQDTITVNAVSLLAATGQDIEYVISTAHVAPPDEWQDETTFIELTAGMTYYVFARSKENNHYNAGAAQVSAPFNTLKFAGADVGVPTVKGSPTRTTITVNAVNITSSTGQNVEYAIGKTQNAPEDGWKSGTVFNGLTENTKYYVFARSVENDRYGAGVPSVSDPIKTAKATSSENAAAVKLPKTKITKLAAGKKLAKLTFKKAKSSLKVTSYQIQYRVKGAKKWTSKTV